VMISHFLSQLQSKWHLQGIKNEFIVTPSAANNYATKANVELADKVQRILKLRAVKTRGPNLRSGR
jgi:hypothetical protein